MKIKIALAGNPNCGKTTLFNMLTGSDQYIGNWAGVTVEKKEGKLINHDNITIEDLPGIYSLSPYTKEEIVTRDYLINSKPDCILNIVDGTNIERNLYLTTQLKELGIPMVIAINMIDIIEKNGDKIDLETLSKTFHCPVIGISALKTIGTYELINLCLKEINNKEDIDNIPHVFTGSVEHSLAHIEETIQDKVKKRNLRWYAIKIFERDKKAYESLNLSDNDKSHLENHIKECEEELGDKSICILTNDRYNYISKLLSNVITKSTRKDILTLTDKIDRFLTHRFFAIPLFAIIMYLVYSIAMGPFGTYLTGWMQNVLISDIISRNLSIFLININVDLWVQSLLIDGVINGVGTVISFVPQMILLFLFISILEDSGYMARVAFIFDRLFRKFGLSGKSFIPMIIGSGCGVPAIMACRTIEEERDRRLTIILATFIPCTAKMEIILLISQIFFDGSSLVATSMYFIGIIVVILSGIILKKLKYFSKDPVPFVIELPSYHLPSLKNTFLHVKNMVKDFIIKAGTVIFIACIISWFLMNYNFRLEMVDINDSILKYIGEKIAFIFAPLGFGNWQCAVSSISALIAKEQAAATLSILASHDTDTLYTLKESIQFIFDNNPIKAMSFAIFNIFNVPCIAAVATAFREHNSIKWGFITLFFQMFIGYILAFFIYQIGTIIYMMM